MYCANIVVDKMLVLRATDEEFYKLVGDKNYGALSVSAHPDDLPLIYDAIDKLEYGSPIKICYRVRTADDTYHFMLVQFLYENELCVQKDRIRVIFTDLDEISSAVDIYKRELGDAERFLAMTEAILFSYNRNDKHLIVFTSNWNEQYILFDGDDKEWVKSMETLPIVEADRDILNHITEELINGSGDFVESVNFVLNTTDNLFGRIPEYFAGQCVTVKGRRVKDGDLDRVMGIISMKNAQVNTNADGLVDSCLDSTFNVYNKKTVTNYAENSIAQGKSGYICIMDIDNFKTVNDTYGHSFGDEVIKTVIEISRAGVKGAGMLGRIGGDEFMMVLDRDVSYADLRSKMRAIRSKVEFEFQSKGYKITVSIGCANYENNKISYETAFKLADKMLYRAKEKGRNRYVIYEPEIHGQPEEVLAGGVVMKDKIRGKAMVSRESFIMTFADLFIRKKTMSYSMAAEAIAEVFDLDEVHLYFDTLDTPKYSYFAEHSSENISVKFLDCELFKLRMNDQNVVAVAHPNTLADQDSELIEHMIKYDYEAMVVYKGELPTTCFVFAKRGTDIRKWENSDVAYLGFISKMLEMEHDNR